MKKTWREKLADDKGLPKVCDVRAGKGVRTGAGRMVIAAPREVDELMKRAPKSRVITINELRAKLAKKNRADFACPITTGIFSWIAAHAAAEAEAEGKKRITPYWRTPKLGGVDALAKKLRAEGHKIVRKSKPTLVADHEQKLFTKLR